MKRFFTFLTFVVFIVTSSFAQSFEVYDEADELINGETITIATEVGGPEDIFDIKVKNTSGSQITAKIGYTLQTTMIDGSMQSMCNPTTTTTPTGYCGMPWATSSHNFVLNSGETSSNGQLHFTQGSNPGVTTIEYKVYDENNESDYVTFTITYTTSSYAGFAALDEFSVFPNPAVNSFTVQNEFGPNSHVEIYNVLGMQVSRVDFSSNGETEIDCSNWEKGYYFCRLYNNGKVEKTIKLTVTH